MKKIKMIPNQKPTFEEGCNKYLEYCRQRNLRQGTIRHYHQSFIYFYKYLDKNMPIENFAKYWILSRSNVIHLSKPSNTQQLNKPI